MCIVMPWWCRLPIGSATGLDPLLDELEIAQEAAGQYQTRHPENERACFTFSTVSTPSK